MTKPAFKFHHLFSSTYKVSLPSGEFLGNVEFDDGLVEGFTFFHSSVKNEGDAAQLVVEIGDSPGGRCGRKALLFPFLAGPGPYVLFNMYVLRSGFWALLGRL